MSVNCGRQVTTNGVLLLCRFCFVFRRSCLVVAEAFCISLPTCFNLYLLSVRKVSSSLVLFFQVVSLEQIRRSRNARL